MTDYLLAAGVATFIVYAAFQVSYIVSVKRTSERVNNLVRNAEGNFTAALQELSGTLENLRKISADVRAVTDDVRHISDSIVRLEKSMQQSLAYLKHSLGAAAEANLAGLRAGITTGVATLVRNLHEGRREQHERGTGED